MSLTPLKCYLTNLGSHAALTCHHASDVSGFAHVEDNDRQVVVHAQRDRRSIHYFELSLQHLPVRVRRGAGLGSRMLDDPALYNNLTSMVGSVDSLVAAIGSPTGAVGKMLADTSLYPALLSVAQRSDSLLGMLSSGQGSAGKMLTDQQLYDQLNKLVTDLNAILEDVRRKQAVGAA